MTILEKAAADAIATIQTLRAMQPRMDQAAQLVGDCLIEGGKLLVCGNGGSAADGADFATEFTCRFHTDRQPYPAIDLTASGSLTTAIGNDYSFTEVFARQVRAFGKRGDVLVAISTSGNSANVIAALRAARETGVSSVALLGRDGGTALGIADVELVVAGAVTARIQEAHKFLLHVLCEMVEQGWLLKKP
jgi:D-sedoheptulose 7-phosphate isomerase